MADVAGARELRGSNADERLTDVARMLKDLGTKFVILDEAQRLDTDHRADSDNIKVFGETLNATIIGISLAPAPLFTGKHGE